MRKPPLSAPASFRCSSVFSLPLAALLVAGSFTAAASFAAPDSEKRVYSPQELATMPAPGPNPYLSYLPVGAEVDWNYWNQKIAETARLRATKRELLPGQLLKGATAVTETEPNDTLGTAQAIPTFGTGAGEDGAIQITGSFPAPPAGTPFTPATEDEGDIPAASPTGLSDGEVVTASGNIGDGPHGSSGSGSADFDFFSITGATAGSPAAIAVTTANPAGDLDPNCAAWDSAGMLIGFAEDIDVFASNFDCQLEVTVPADGTVYFSIGGWKAGGQAAVLPGDPFDSASGTGAASEGDYDVAISLGIIGDQDCFSVNLEVGDILGTGTSGTITRVSTYNPSDAFEMGSEQTLSGLYPTESPLPSTGANAELIAYEAGDHKICVVGTEGSYTLDVSAHRSVFENSGTQQTLFIDFDGATLDPGIFGGTPGSATLSPLSSFLTGWGLTAGDEDAVIDAIMASMEESITADLAALNNPNFSVALLNSRDHADPFGQPNVSRVVVGGTIAELGISTIGIAQTIDPGNFGTVDSAVTLLDLLSEVASNPNSLNQFDVDPNSSQIALVGTGVGNITAHEAGHFLGNWHTENAAPSEPGIMDRGGDLANSVGVGPDGDFGTADDIDVDFTGDDFSSAEGLLGTEQTGQRTAFALTGDLSLFVDGFESGDTSAWSITTPPIP